MSSVAAGQVREALATGSRLLGEVAESLSEKVASLGLRIAQRLGDGGRVLTAGNGGSAADAQHVACELSGRFLLDRPALDVMALTTNSSVLTAVGNDFGYEEVFSRQVDAHGREGDFLLLFSTSGSSANVTTALEAGRRRGMVVVGFTGEGGTAFAESCDEALVVPSSETPRIQEAHIALGHALCQVIESTLFGGTQTWGDGPSATSAAGSGAGDAPAAEPSGGEGGERDPSGGRPAPGGG